MGDLDDPMHGVETPAAENGFEQRGGPAFVEGKEESSQGLETDAMS